MVAIKVDAKGLDKVTKRLQAQIERAKNLAPVLQPIAAALKTHIDDSFRQSKSPTGEAWAPLSRATIAGRRQGSDKPLIDTGTLRNAAYAMVEGNDSIVFGDNVSYVGPQQFGAEIHGTYKEPAPKKHGPTSPARRKAANKAKRTIKGPKLFRGQHAPGNTTLYAKPVGPRFRSQKKHAPGSAYTIKIPARPFLPVNADGSIIFKGGPLENLNERVIEYIRSGKKSGK
ncbi:MAG: phage virion morphogenesis protein [Sandaracinaceae bacterium]|nr:phage virion morphogenesis protein [Sandaracinaceae bacterium]